MAQNQIGRTGFTTAADPMLYDKVQKDKQRQHESGMQSQALQSQEKRQNQQVDVQKEAMQQDREMQAQQLRARDKDRQMQWDMQQRSQEFTKEQRLAEQEFVRTDRAERMNYREKELQRIDEANRKWQQEESERKMKEIMLLKKIGDDSKLDPAKRAEYERARKEYIERYDSHMQLDDEFRRTIDYKLDDLIGTPEETEGLSPTLTPVKQYQWQKQIDETLDWALRQATGGKISVNNLNPSVSGSEPSVENRGKTRIDDVEQPLWGTQQDMVPNENFLDGEKLEKQVKDGTLTVRDLTQLYITAEESIDRLEEAYSQYDSPERRAVIESSRQELANLSENLKALAHSEDPEVAQKARYALETVAGDSRDVILLRMEQDFEKEQPTPMTDEQLQQEIYKLFPEMTPGYTSPETSRPSNQGGTGMFQSTDPAMQFAQGLQREEEVTGLSPYEQQRLENQKKRRQRRDKNRR